jgi:hypothetical protein
MDRLEVYRQQHRVRDARNAIQNGKGATHSDRPLFENAKRNDGSVYIMIS